MKSNLLRNTYYSGCKQCPCCKHAKSGKILQDAKDVVFFNDLINCGGYSCETKLDLQHWTYWIYLVFSENVFFTK